MSERELFIAALQIPEPAERTAWLDRECGDDAALRQRIGVLLRAFENAGSLLENQAGAVSPTSDGPNSEVSGTVIGPYTLLQQIGEGGMGTVYMAEQSEPIQRKVALKIIKPGMDSKQVIARFEAERQALAMMDHVNIARVLDAGTTEAGLPYFVMEVVHGVPITKYCDDNHLTPRERLELFVPVCQAIQHAHQKGIIHRDIKPSNVMVTLYDGKPVPKVIDFGVAKATEQKLTERTLFTQYGTMVGTLEYMSPEQAEMSALGVDTRSDIYSLGVLLYELLTGSTPLTHKRMKEAAYAEILRMIKEEEPPKPSTRLSDSGEALASISANRHTEPAKLTKLVRGELDWIVMKTLEKDRNRRYETAKDFAADVLRYLADEPVQACPPTAGYRLRKFVRRNKVVLAIAGLVLFFIGLLGGGAGWAVRDRAARENEFARERALKQTAVEHEASLALKEAEQLQGQGKWPEALSAAKRAEALLAGGGSEELREHAHQLRNDLEMVLRLEDIRLLSSETKDNRIDYEKTDRAYAQAFGDFGINVPDLPVEEAAKRLRARGIAVEVAAAFDVWAVARWKTQPGGGPGWRHLRAVARAVDPDPWRNRVREACEKQDKQALTDLAAREEMLALPAATLSQLGRVLRDTGMVEQALTLLRQAQRRHPDDFWINVELANCSTALRPPQVDEAVRYNTAAASLRPRSAFVYANLGLELYRMARYDEAIACCRKAIELEPKFAPAHTTLGLALCAQKKLDEAIAACRKAIELDPKDGPAHSSLGNVLYAQKKLDEAVACCRKAIELDPKYAPAHTNLGLALCAQKKLDEGIAACRKAVEIDPKLASTHSDLGALLREQNKLTEAIACYHTAIALDPKFAPAYNNLGLALFDQKKPDEAIACYRTAIALDPKSAIAYYNFGLALFDQKKPDEAIACFRKAIALDPKYVKPQNNLGVALNQKGLVAEAIACYRKAIELDPKDAKAHANLGIALGDQLKFEDAIACFRKAIELDPKNANYYYSLGLALGQQRKVDDAIASFRKAIELDPKYAFAHNALGNSLSGQKKLDEAIACYRKAIELDPKDALVHINLGIALRDQKKFDEAIACFRMAIELDPKFGAAHNKLGTALDAQGKLDEASAAFRKAIELDPKDASPHFNLGRVLFAQKKLDEASASFRKAIELDPKHAGAHFGLGLVLHQQQKLNEASACYHKAIEFDPKYAVAYSNLGAVLATENKLDEAIACFHKAIELDPNNVKNHANLGRTLQRQGKVDDAIAAFEEALRLEPDNAMHHNSLAWLLATCLKAKSRDPKQAVELAKRAIQLESKNGLYWQTFGYAEYRAGNWKSAITALEKVKELGSAGDSLEWFPLAMAHWQLGEKDKAREWFDKATAWMDKHQPKSEELRRLRTEAAALLKIADDPKTKPNAK